MESNISIINYGKIEEKNDEYYYYGGLINCLSPSELYKAFDFKFSFKPLMRKLLIRKIEFSIDDNSRQIYRKLFSRAIRNISGLNTYYNKQACSQFLFELFDHLSTAQKNRFIKYLLTSRYIRDHSRAYILLEKYWNPKYENMLKDAFQEYLDNDALELMIEKVNTEYFTPHVDYIYSLFDEDYLSWEDMLLRNKFLIKISPYVHDNILEKLKVTDPVSYIYVCKESKKKIDEDFALNLFMQYPEKKYLILWYGEMGLREIIGKINEFLTKA